MQYRLHSTAHNSFDNLPLYRPILQPIVSILSDCMLLQVLLLHVLS